MTSLAHICTSPAAGHSWQAHMPCTIAPDPAPVCHEPKRNKKKPVDKHTAVDHDTTRPMWTLSGMSDNVAETQATAHVAEGRASDSCEAMITGLPGDVCDPASIRNTPVPPRPPGSTGHHYVINHIRGVHCQVGNDLFRQWPKRRTTPPPPNVKQRAIPVTSRCLSLSIDPLSLYPPLPHSPLSSQC